MTVLLLDSITDADSSARGCIAVSGSHGGIYAASVASRAGLRAVVLNDAGKGLDDAGIAGVRKLADAGMAACAVDCFSAEIGSARDMRDNGLISFANGIARDLGIEQGDSVKHALDRLADAPDPVAKLDEVPEARWEEEIISSKSRILCVDSASLIKPSDAGRLIVTGSHGGLIGGNPARACKAEARLVVFSDAGRGKNDIGLSRLPALDKRGIAAATLDCNTCAIGSAASAFATGTISAVNRSAAALGLAEGSLLIDALRNILRLEEPVS